MTLKRIYNLKNQRITYRHGDEPKLCVCLTLIIIVICGSIALAAFLVKSIQSSSNSKETHGQVNYHDVGNNKSSSVNGKLIQISDVKNEFVLTSVNGNVATISNTAQFTSATIESPFSTSTIPPPSEGSPRYLIVKTINGIEVPNSDYSPVASENDEVEVTTPPAFFREESSITMRHTTDVFDESASAMTQKKDIVDELASDESVSSKTYSNSVENTTPTMTIGTQSGQNICNTNNCKQSTSRMLALVNHSTNPCEDFYSYACGGFQINHFKEFTVNEYVLESLPDISTLDLTIPYKKLYHDFFISCMKYKNGGGLMKLSKLLYDLCQDHNNGLTDLIADILMIHPQRTLSRLMPLFDVTMEVGPKKTLIPTVSLPKLKSLHAEDDSRNFYERSCRSLTEMEAIDKKNKTIIQDAYKKCLESRNEYFKNLEKSIFLLQIFEHLPEFKKMQKIKQTLDFIELSIIDEIGSISADELENSKYDTVALNWLKSAYPKIEWTKLFTKLFGKEVAESITNVRLTHSTYLVKIFEFYSRHSFEDIKTSILSMMAHDMYMDFMEPLLTSNRFTYCSNIATKPDIASKLYLESLSVSLLNIEQTIKKIFDQLVETFEISLNENDWVHKNVKKEVASKISGLRIMSDPYLGFINFKENFSKLYGEANIDANDFISNVFALKKVVRRRMYDTHGRSALLPEVIWNHLLWPISTSPIRIPGESVIVLPTSLVAPFNYGSQKVEEFATIGFLIAQEMSRLIYDEKTSELFIERKENFRSNVEIHLQDPAYSRKPNIFGIQLTEGDVTSSQHSRFIDDMTLRVTYDTYDRYRSLHDDKSLPWTDNSAARTFYLLTSQQFCNAKMSSVEVAINLLENDKLPNYFRINSIMMNSEHFLNSFTCKNLA